MANTTIAAVVSGSVGAALGSGLTWAPCRACVESFSRMAAFWTESLTTVSSHVPKRYYVHACLKQNNLTNPACPVTPSQSTFAACFRRQVTRL